MPRILLSFLDITSTFMSDTVIDIKAPYLHTHLNVWVDIYKEDLYSVTPLLETTRSSAILMKLR
jgi:hypothetical protein